MIKGCIFDLDGTLLDTLTTIAYFANGAMVKNGFPQIPVERYKTLVGTGARSLVRKMLTEIGEDPEKHFDCVYRDYLAAYNAAPLYLTHPYAGIPELLAALSDLGIVSAVLSNKPDTATVPIVNAFFPGAFAFARGSVDGQPLKPAPDGVYAILSRLALRPEEVLYIGDTGTDMDTGKNAGLPTVGCLWGFRDETELRAHGAAYLASSPEDIAAIIKKINSKD